MDIYEPREDSFLLQKFVKKLAKGTVLDMGTGSGIQAATAAASKKVVKVYGLDINEDAIVHCVRTHRSKKLKFVQSDLFSVFRRYKVYDRIQFDMITFNAPYLPTDSSYPDVALDGGKLGHELVCKFLKGVGAYLKPRGTILLLFSSLTGRERVDACLFKYGWRFKEIGTEHVGFEDLIVYSITSTGERHGSA
jgi:release factor glutamine methyltransferase|tara:strand:+ start:741 stop:1319 length:579 start_codon:yes stop_codon:yes gene_type:complete